MLRRPFGPLGVLAWLLPALVLAGCARGPSSAGRDAEYYESILLAGTRVGWSHTTRSTVKDDGVPLIRTRNETVITLAREGQPVTQRMILICWETSDGTLVRFESQQDNATTAQGAVADGRLTVTRTTGGKSETEVQVWKDWGGFFAPTDSLWRSPIRPGEKRAIRSLTPLMNVAATTWLEALSKESVELPGGARELLKVRGRVTLGETDLEMLFWVDDRGEVLRTQIPAINQESIRVTKAEALQPLPRQDFDLLVDSVVKLSVSPPDLTQARQVVYRATLKSGNISSVFSDGISQHVRVIDDQTAAVTVLAVRPDWPARSDPPQLPLDDYLLPTTFLQSDDPRVQEIAASIAGDEADPWRIAVALEQRVHQLIRKKDYSQAMASAAEVARDLQGDCTEHAVLLAACLKSRNIPSRVAFGLVYVPALEGFSYHMWTEAFVTDRWIPLDATQGHGGIGCDHLKLGDSNLAGADTYSDVLKVVTVFRQLELSVVSTE